MLSDRVSLCVYMAMSMSTIVRRALSKTLALLVRGTRQSWKISVMHRDRVTNCLLQISLQRRENFGNMEARGQGC